MDRVVQDVERWLDDCAATIAHDMPDGTVFLAECGLPAGHDGPHQDGSVQLPGGRLVGNLRDLADAVERTGHDFGWRAHDLDRDAAGAPSAATHSHDLLVNLAASLESIRHRAARLAAEVRDVCVGLTDEGLSEPGINDGHSARVDRSLSVE